MRGTTSAATARSLGARRPIVRGTTGVATARSLGARRPVVRGTTGAARSLGARSPVVRGTTGATAHALGARRLGTTSRTHRTHRLGSSALISRRHGGVAHLHGPRHVVGTVSHSTRHRTFRIRHHHHHHHPRVGIHFGFRPRLANYRYRYYYVNPPSYVDPYWLAPTPYFGYACVGYGDEYAPYFDDAVEYDYDLTEPYVGQPYIEQPYIEQPYVEQPYAQPTVPYGEQPHAQPTVPYTEPQPYTQPTVPFKPGSDQTEPGPGFPAPDLLPQPHGAQPHGAQPHGAQPQGAQAAPSLDTAIQAFLAGRYAEAEADFQALLVTEPKNGEAWMGLVHVYFANKQYTKSAGAIARASQLGAFPQGYRFDPSPLYPDKSFDRRVQQLELHTNRHPLDVDAWLVRAYFEVALGRQTEAGQSLDRLGSFQRFGDVVQTLRRAALPAPPPPTGTAPQPGR